MINIKNKLEIAADLICYAEERAYDLASIRNPKLKRLYVDYSEVEADKVCVYFKENTNHDCPDSASVELSLKMLEMSEENWNTYLLYERTSYAKKEQEAEAAKEKARQEAKMKQYNSLKNELGL